MRLMGDVQTNHVPETSGPSLDTAYLSAKAVAKVMHVSSQTINNWRRQGHIPASLEIEDTVRYDLAEVRSAVAEMARQKQLARDALKNRTA